MANINPTSPQDPEDMLEFAIELARAAGDVILPSFRNHQSVENKKDSGFDPVTEADRSAEQVMRTMIEARFGDHDILGEEFGHKATDSDYCWILDPIDGTRSFISGIPTWMTLIGLTYKGKPVAGVACQPFTSEIYAGTSAGSFLLHGDTRTPLKCSDETNLSAVLTGTTGPHLYEEHGHTKRLETLAQSVRHIRYDTDAYFYCMVASGQLGISLDTGLQAYDIVALIPIVEGAGGMVTTWSGGDAANGGNILCAANKDLHEQAVAILN